MDLEAFKRLAIAQVEAGRMVELVHAALKKAAHAKQDAYEGRRESFEPVLAKLETLREEVARSAPPKPPGQEAEPGHEEAEPAHEEAVRAHEEGVPALEEAVAAHEEGVPALEEQGPFSLVQGPDGAPSYASSDDFEEALAEPEHAGAAAWHSLSCAELGILAELGLPAPADVHGPEDARKARDAGGKMNQKLGPSKKGKTPEERAQIEKKMRAVRKNNEYMDRALKRAVAMGGHPFAATGKDMRRKRGGALTHYRTIEDLLDRLELLGCSLQAGNDSKAVKQEFAAIGHKLRDLGTLTNSQLSALMRGYLA